MPVRARRRSPLSRDLSGVSVNAFTSWLRGSRPQEDVVEASVTRAPAVPERAGYEFGVPRGGLTEYNAGIGQSTQSDRQSMLSELYEAYLGCPWAWACCNAISRTITAGGLVTDWDNDDGEGDEDQPEKPAAVLALEKLITFVNPREDMRQLLRSTISDLLVFGDAYIEVSFVGNIPVALYTLDSPSTHVIADEHGTITGYVQITEFGQRAMFEPREVIHFSLDSPRSGVFGVSPTQAALLPITSWLFAAATVKEVFRKGNPPNLWVDMPPGMPTNEQNRWLAQHAARNVGPRNIGVPVMTKGGAKVQELQQSKIAEYLATLDQKRDEILAAYGVPPAEATVIEAGNLGGGTGESQHRTFTVNTCQPLAELVLEKLNYHIVKVGFGVTGWHVKFRDIDMRDSKVIEDIRDQRLRNGSWTLNKYRTEIGEQPVDGGDDAVLVDRQTLVLWRDLQSYSTSGIAQKLKGTALEPGEPPEPGTPVTLQKPEPAPIPPGLAPFAGQNNPAGDDSEDPDAHDGAENTETAKRPGSWAPPVPSASWQRAYRQRLREALRELPDVGPDAAA